MVPKAPLKTKHDHTSKTKLRGDNCDCLAFFFARSGVCIAIPVSDNENNITRKSVLGTQLESKGGKKFTIHHELSSVAHSHPPIHTEERGPMCDDVCTFSAEMTGA